MGDVYRARDTRLDRIVAVKVAKEQFPERFEREAKAVAALNNQHVCHLYDVGPNYLVMEYVDGASLAPVDTPEKLLDIASADCRWPRRRACRRDHPPRPEARKRPDHA